MATKPEDRRVKYTKMVLRDSLIQLLGQKELSHITIKEICDTADINRATFYAHYADQYDLLEQIENELFNNIHVYLSAHEQEGYPRNVTELNATISMVTDIFDYIKANAPLFKLLLNDRGNLSFQKRIMTLVYDPYFSQLSQGSTLGKDEMEYVYAFALTGCVGAVQTWLDNGMPQSSRIIAEMLIGLFYGLASGVPGKGEPRL